MKPVSLTALVYCLDWQSDDLSAYIDPATGEVVSASTMFDDDLTPESAEEAGMIHVPKIEADEEIRSMRRFARGHQDADARDALLDALDGPRPFRRFKDAVYRLGIRDAWFAAQAAGRAESLRDWLTAEKIPFVDDVPLAATAEDPSAADATVPDPAPQLRVLRGGRTPPRSPSGRYINARARNV